MQGAGCRVHGAGCRVQGAGCRVQGAGCSLRRRESAIGVAKKTAETERYENLYSRGEPRRTRKCDRGHKKTAQRVQGAASDGEKVRVMKLHIRGMRTVDVTTKRNIMMMMMM